MSLQQSRPATLADGTRRSRKIGTGSRREEGGGERGKMIAGRVFFSIKAS